MTDHEKDMLIQPAPERVAILIGQAYFVTQGISIAEVQIAMRRVLETDALFEHEDPDTQKLTLLRVPAGTIVQILPFAEFERQQQAARVAQAQQQLAAAPVALRPNNRPRS